MKDQYIPDICFNCRNLYKEYHDNEHGCKLGLFWSKSYYVAYLENHRCTTKKHKEDMKKYDDTDMNTLMKILSEKSDNNKKLPLEKNHEINYDHYDPDELEIY